MSFRSLAQDTVLDPYQDEIGQRSAPHSSRRLTDQSLIAVPKMSQDFAVFVAYQPGTFHRLSELWSVIPTKTQVYRGRKL
jgi:hypothetical protein